MSSINSFECDFLSVFSLSTDIPFILVSLLSIFVLLSFIILVDGLVQVSGCWFIFLPLFFSVCVSVQREHTVALSYLNIHFIFACIKCSLIYLDNIHRMVGSSRMSIKYNKWMGNEREREEKKYGAQHTHNKKNVELFIDDVDLIV